jgi:hypothetical protein
MARFRETGLTLAAALVVALFCVVLLVWDPGFFFIDDAQSGALPGYCEMNRAWRTGELPLLNRTSWHAGAIAGEYPSGVFSPSLILSILLVFSLGLSLPLTFAALAIIHLAILAAGAFRLARQRGLTGDLSLLVALVASLNGWIIFWGARNWGVCLFSFAWVPWVWWGLEFARRMHGRLRFVPAGFFLYLLIAAGWPFTVLMAMLLSGWVMIQTWAQRRRLLDAWPTVAAWVIGLGLSAPSWMTFLEYAPHAARIQASAGMRSNGWSVPFEALPGLVLPNVTTLWYVFNTIKLHESMELAGGLVPLVILVGCFWYGGRAYFRALRWDWGFCGLLFVLVTSPSIGNFRYSFRWLPLLFLTLGLLAAQSLAWLREKEKGGGSRLSCHSETSPDPFFAGPNLGRIALYLILFIWIRATMSQPDAGGLMFRAALGLLGLAFLWWQIEERAPAVARARRLMPAAMVFLSCGIAYVTSAPSGEVPTWQISEQIRQPGPLDPKIRYLSVHTLQDIMVLDDTPFHERLEGIGAELYFGNTAAFAGLDFVNGYSPMLPLGMQQLFHWEPHGGFYNVPQDVPALAGSTLGLIGSPLGQGPLLAAAAVSPDRIATDAERILVSETGPHGLLQLMGVDGLVVADRFQEHEATLAKNGWRPIARVQGGRVFHRAGAPSPRVRTIREVDLIENRFVAGRRLTHHGRDPLPSILLAAGTSGQQTFAPARVRLLDDNRNSAVAEVASEPGKGDILVVFSRPWFPGYQARCNGRSVPVEVYNLILPAVRVPAGTNGTIELTYRPNSLVLGAFVAGVTLLGILMLLVLAAARRLRRNAASRAPLPLNGWIAGHKAPPSPLREEAAS